VGNFVIKVEAAGSHGCQREVPSGQKVAAGCGAPGCPDCIARLMVALLKKWGTNVGSATLTHWPNPDGTLKADSVVDDLLTYERKGSFNLKHGESNLS